MRFAALAHSTLFWLIVVFSLIVSLHSPGIGRGRGQEEAGLAVDQPGLPASASGVSARKTTHSWPVNAQGSQPVSGLPAEYALGHNYPNPFNPTTTIEFSLPEPSKVFLRIYNLIGQHVATLVDGETGPGAHAARWDGRDLKGSIVSGWVYFYVIDAVSLTSGKTFHALEKMAFLK